MNDIIGINTDADVATEMRYAHGHVDTKTAKTSAE
jgi:hypothetical protein